MPAIDDIGYAAGDEINQRLKQSIGLTLSEQHLYTLVKGAIVGPSSGLNVDGCSLAVSVFPANEARSWERFNSLAAWKTLSAVSDSEGGGPKQSWNRASTLMADVQSSSEPLDYLQGALVDKISLMTMINREDIRRDRSLEEYGLDSLVSVELRNWLRREFGTELPLNAIVGAEHVRALSEKILSLMPVKT